MSEGGAPEFGSRAAPCCVSGMEEGVREWAGLLEPGSGRP